MSYTEQILDDCDWWKNQLPIGWTLYGFTYRKRAAAYSPSNRFVEVDGELLIALRKENKNDTRRIK